MNNDYLNRFEQNLQQELLRLCTQYKMLSGTLLASEDLDARWHELAPEYMADAVKEIAQYPTVSVAWAGYLGLAVAHGWDLDWESARTRPYNSYYGEQGFDDLDEYILYRLMGLEPEGPDAQALEETIRAAAQLAVTLIRREQVEPQSPTAFYIFARACKVMFRIGAAMQLYRLGYSFEQVALS